MKTECNVVVTDARRCFHVCHRLDSHRVGKEDVASLQVIGSAVERNIPFGDAHASKHRGPCCGAPQPDVHIARHAGHRCFQAQLWSRDDVDIEANIINQGIGSRRIRGLLGALNVTCEIELRR